MQKKQKQVADRLKRFIRESLRKQGLTIHRDRIRLPDSLDKEGIRQLHRQSVEHKVERARAGLERHEDELLLKIASGKDVDPARIQPRLVEVRPGSKEELLFRYATAHWSIPVSSGYGRRLRFVVIDGSNDKLIGVIGLGDPVFGLRARDEWIGWNHEHRRARLRYIMDAFALGAVPPYSFLICGKLVASLACSAEVRNVFRRKYRGAESLIGREQQDGRLAMITTTSALGRSSVYNRLRFEKRLLFRSVGFTSGFGEFQFCNGVYDAIREYADRFCEHTAKNEEWGEGFRNRREVVRKVLGSLEMSVDLMNHGIRREIFVAPLAENSREFLRGDRNRLRWHHESANDLSSHFLERWLKPRAQRDTRFEAFDRQSYRLWRK